MDNFYNLLSKQGDMYGPDDLCDINHTNNTSPSPKTINKDNQYNPVTIYNIYYFGNKITNSPFGDLLSDIQSYKNKRTALILLKYIIRKNLIHDVDKKIKPTKLADFLSKDKTDEFERFGNEISSVISVDKKNTIGQILYKKYHSSNKSLLHLFFTDYPLKTKNETYYSDFIYIHCIYSFKLATVFLKYVIDNNLLGDKTLSTDEISCIFRYDPSLITKYIGLQIMLCEHNDGKQTKEEVATEFLSTLTNKLSPPDNCENIINLLLKEGADPNVYLISNYCTITPVFYYANNRAINIVRLLIKHGADVNIINITDISKCERETVLDIALKKYHDFNAIHEQLFIKDAKPIDAEKSILFILDNYDLKNSVIQQYLGHIFKYIDYSTTHLDEIILGKIQNHIYTCYLCNSGNTECSCSHHNIEQFSKYPSVVTLAHILGSMDIFVNYNKYNCYNIDRYIFDSKWYEYNYHSANKVPVIPTSDIQKIVLSDMLGANNSIDRYLETLPIRVLTKYKTHVHDKTKIALIEASGTHALDYVKSNTGLNVNNCLLWAIIHCNLDMIRYLVEERSADVRYKNSIGMELACKAKSLEIIRYLVDHKIGTESINCGAGINPCLKQWLDPEDSTIDGTSYRYLLKHDIIKIVFK